MTLLKPMHLWTGDQIGDMNMFDHLSEAGITVGSQIEVSNVDVDILLENAVKKQIFRTFVENLGNGVKQSADILESLFEKIKMLVNMVEQDPQYLFFATENVLKKSDENIDSFLIDILSKTVLDCVLQKSKNEICADRQSNYRNKSSELYEIISQTLAKNLKPHLESSNVLRDGNICFNEIDKLFAMPETLSQIKNNIKTLAAQSTKINKVGLIKAMIYETAETKTDILDNIRGIMQNETIDELFESARNLICHDPALLPQIVSEMKKQTQNLSYEDNIAETLRSCIVSAVKTLINNNIEEITKASKDLSSEKMKEYLMDTLSLARALGFTDCILSLSNIINDNGDIVSQLKEDEKNYELLQRVIVMHKLSQNNEMHEKSLKLLRENPYSARTDVVLRELLTCSGICTINLVEGNRLQDSNDIPLSLIYSGNQLAIEDFLIRKQSKPRGPILIVKDCFQAVVPRESSRDVLTGKCAYTVLDENGIFHFEPLHMFTALKLKNVTMFEDRYSSYAAQNNAKNHDFDIDNIMNRSAIATALSNGFIAYKSIILPRKELNNLYIAQRYPAKKFNHSRSFYL